MVYSEGKESDMIVGVTGTRVGWTKAQKTAFTLIIADLDITEFHHGDAVGCDEQAARAVKKRFGLQILHCHPPDDSKARAFVSGGTIYPEKPYLERNKDIARAVELLIVLPQTAQKSIRSGTWHTYRCALAMDKRIIVIGPEGERVE